jgi:preprotein translocase subunit SecF
MTLMSALWVGISIGFLVGWFLSVPTWLWLKKRCP